MSTAKGLLPHLSAESGHKIVKDERDIAIAERKTLLAAAAKNIADELLEHGVEVRSIGSRFKSHKDNVAALPVLSKHLAIDYPSVLREALARSMAISEAIPYRTQVVTMFRELTGAEDRFRYGLGLIIAKTTNQDNLEETLSLAKDTKLGVARMALLLAVKPRRKQPLVAGVISELKGDPDLVTEILSW